MLIVLHIALLIPIANYCAVLPVPGHEEGVLEKMLSRFLHFEGPASFMLMILSFFASYFAFLPTINENVNVRNQCCSEG